jgi:NADH-quinone oxidoreductase subunit C
MTTTLSGKEIKRIFEQVSPAAVIEISDCAALIKANSLVVISDYLKNNRDQDFNYLNYITATDYFDYFELVYQLTSFQYNRSIIFRIRCHDREKPSVPSITSIWRGADLQEREIFDLFGITFTGHPDMKRIFLWEGFQGYPLRKDFQLK